MGDFMQTRSLRRVVRHHEKMASFYFDRPFDIAPGQFVNLWLPNIDEKPFSASNLTDDELEITICAVGPFTQAMMDTRPGEMIGIRGPFGRGYDVRGPALLVGGGMGIAPLRFLANHLANAGVPFSFAAGARSSTDIPFADELAAQGTCFATDDGSRGTAGQVTAILVDRLVPQRFDTLCGCGPEGLLIALKNLAETHDLHYQLAFERYMKCAIGICGQCCLDGSGIRVCTEGPVLGPDQLSQVTDLGLPHRGPSGLRRA